ncbi:Brp/Blh family beta-carotene 15,15'-dioxygenase [Candidatus Pelagibacter sp.]|nr:Brp/Blh family beta-carotene 15,15'-dioxygenase [Candidatus Pelagibacter sp.]
MIRINFYHSLIFFNLCILLCGIKYLREGSFLLISLFLILTIGISHGSLDHIKGKKLIKYFGYKSMSIFYLSYLLIGAVIILVWLIFPKSLLFLFLIIAAYHFGKEDSEFINQKERFELIYFLKGSLIITSPLFFHKEETLAIFETLNFYISNNLIITNNILLIFILLSLISGIILSLNKSIEAKSLLLMDYLSILILNYFLNPIIAFTIYFCFLHSIRHSISLIREINKNLTKGLPIFVKKALPLTILTIFGYVVSILILNNYNEFNETIYRVIFIGLASLTFPHILLEYLIEKNEQQKY